MLRILHNRQRSDNRNAFISSQESVVMPTGESVSRFLIEIEIVGKGVLLCELTRHTAPLTCSALLKNLPIEDRVHRLGDSIVYAESKLSIGPEKQRASFNQRDVAFLTSNGSICVFLKYTIGYKMNLIGQVTKNFELASSTQPGDTMKIRRG